MSDTFRLLDPSMVLSPGLLFDRDVIARNIHAMIARVGSPERLRPHVKTHKTRDHPYAARRGHHPAEVRHHRRG